MSLLFPMSQNFYIGPSVTFNHMRYAHDGGDPKIDAINVPVALRAKYYIRNEGSSLYPWLRVDAGYIIGALDSTSKFYYCPTIGFSKGFADNSHSIDIGIGYLPMTADNEFMEVTSGVIRASVGLTF